MSTDTRIDELASGDTITAEVTRKNSTNGLVETPDSHINIGQVKDEIVGESVDIEIIWCGSYAIGRCLDEEFVESGYDPRNNAPAETPDWKERKSKTMNYLPDRT